MLSGFKGKGPEPDKNTAVNPDEPVTRAVPPPRMTVEQVVPRSEPARKSGPDSCIGSDMSIVGNIDCNGPAQVFGRIEGELRASELLIGDSAKIEGTVIAQNVTVCGHVKGTIRAVRVKLQDGGTVAGDIFHRSLSIDENSLFEGSSRRVENPMDASAGADAKGSQKKDIQGPAAISNIVDSDLQRVESTLTDWSETTVGPKQ